MILLYKTTLSYQQAVSDELFSMQRTTRGTEESESASNEVKL